LLGISCIDKNNSLLTETVAGLMHRMHK